eukprot:684712-Pelagomonas_calceolata.AAC.5
MSCHALRNAHATRRTYACVCSGCDNVCVQCYRTACVFWSHFLLCLLEQLQLHLPTHLPEQFKGLPKLIDKNRINVAHRQATSLQLKGRGPLSAHSPGKQASEQAPRQLAVSNMHDTLTHKNVTHSAEDILVDFCMC